MTNLKEFTENAHVVHKLNNLKSYLVKNPLNVSDIQDNNGRQYVDLVQEGGGILGISLVGFVYALEEVGIRFVSLAGTSAGAINTALLAAVDSPNKKKALTILEVINETDFRDFIDGGKDAKKLVMKISRGVKHPGISSILRFLDDFILRNESGLNRGDTFYDWLLEIFSKFSTETTSDLLNKMNVFPSELLEKHPDLKAHLAIISCDITTQTKVNFPSMAELYYKYPDDVNPADFVRASMAIPIFFDPFTIRNIPKGKKQLEKWQDIKNAYFFGDIPDEAVLVDGGVLSNFPIDIFHNRNKIPSRPTFGVKLGIDRKTTKNVNSILDIFLNSFSAARQMRDLEVILRDNDYVKITSNIDDSNINWLNFNLRADEKVELFNRGVTAACQFLKDFSWEEYKRLRESRISTDNSEIVLEGERFSKSFIN